MSYNSAAELPDLLRKVSVLVRNSEPLTAPERNVVGEVLVTAANVIEQQANSHADLAASVDGLVETLNEMISIRGQR